MLHKIVSLQFSMRAQRELASRAPPVSNYIDGFPDGDPNAMHVSPCNNILNKTSNTIMSKTLCQPSAMPRHPPEGPRTHASHPHAT